MSVSGAAWVRWRVRLGFPVAAICLWFTRATPAALLAGAAIALVGLAIRASAAGYLRKGEELATSGPYARTRNPLYLGSLLLAMGFVVASRSWIVAVLVFGYFLAFYPFLMRREAAELRALHGRLFDEYARCVPLFWPRLRVRDSIGGANFSLQRYAHNREYQAAVGVVALLVALWALAVWRG
jgi:protein-S-isoprenylcysteine O-methyltransferase Ste14